MPQIILQTVVRGQIEGYAQNMFVQTAQQHREVASIYIDDLFSDSQKAIDLLIKNIHLVYGSDKKPKIEQMTTLLGVVRDGVNYVPNFYVGTEEGNFYLYPPDVLPIGYDPRKRNWYQQAFSNPKEMNWIGPYIDQGTKNLVMTVSKRFDYQGQQGVVGLDMSLDNIRDTIKTKKVGEKGNLFLVDQNGKIIMHQQSMLEGIDIKLTKYRDEDVFMALKVGHAEGRQYIIDALQVTDTLYIVSVIDKKEIAEMINKQISSLNYLIYFFIAVTILLALILSGRLTRPFKGLLKAMQNIINGDYSTEFSYKSNDEIGELVSGFNNMVSHYKQNNDEMSALYEELYASEETLMEQYDELLTRKTALEASEERYRLIFEASTEGIWDIDEKMNLKYHSPIWFKIFDIRMVDPDINDWFKLIHPDDKALFDEQFNNHLNGTTPYFSLEYRVLDNSNKYRWIHTKAKGIVKADDTLLKMAGSHMDITERKLYEEQTISLAYYDTLTGLPNLSNLKRKLNNEIGRNNWGQVFYIDINNFKFLNDSFGHVTGDLIIQQVGERLKRVSPEAFIARTGGDEFVMLFDTILEGDALKRFSDRLIQNLSDPYCVESINTHLTASIVCTKFPHDAKNVEEIFKNIDLTLYYVKNNNSNNISGLQVYDDHIRIEVSKRLYIESNLDKALANEEFVLYYQPIVKVKDEDTFQFEALIRWNDSSKGIVSPNDFIPIAEATGAIIPIGRWVLHEACKTTRQLIDTFNKEISMSVNVSVSQLADPRFIDDIKQCLELYNLPGHLLAIEITESMMTDQMESLKEVLLCIRRLDVKIALDDFGKGFSSLNHLISLPLDLLKIDRAITSKIHTDVHVKALYESIIEYAHKIGVTVIVEGIENSEQSDLSEKMQCDFLQGYLFSKPIPSELVFKYIQSKL